MITFFSNIIYIKSRCNRNTKNAGNHQLADFESNWPNSGFNKALASSKSRFKSIILNISNKSIFFCKIIIGRILEVRVNKPISNSHTFEVYFQIVFIFENKIVRNSRNVVSSVTFSSNIKIFSL